MIVCHCLRRGGRKNCCKEKLREGSKIRISAAAGFLLSMIVNAEGGMRICTGAYRGIEKGRGRDSKNGATTATRPVRRDGVLPLGKKINSLRCVFRPLFFHIFCCFNELENAALKAF